MSKVLVFGTRRGLDNRSEASRSAPTVVGPDTDCDGGDEGVGSDEWELALNSLEAVYRICSAMFAVSAFTSSSDESGNCSLYNKL